MMNHELKIWPQYYSRVKDGTKTFEVRNNDREFQFGDTVTLKEWDPEPVNSTSHVAKGWVAGSEPLHFKIGYIHVLSRTEVIFSLLPIEAEKKVKSKKDV